MQTKAEIIREIKVAGFSVNSLLSVSADSKTIKGQKQGYLTGVQYLMPDDSLCPMSEKAGCRVACLVSAGRAAFTPGIGQARAERTRLFHGNKRLYFKLLESEIAALIRKAERDGMVPAIRLNGTSDINFERFAPYDGLSIFERFSDIQFYDYTKSPSIIRASSSVNNWHITASYSGANKQYSDLILAAAKKYGVNVAVVFSSKVLPMFYNGLPVINGDNNDLRFLDKPNVVVGLSAKGKAKQDQTGFVISVNS